MVAVRWFPGAGGPPAKRRRRDGETSCAAAVTRRPVSLAVRVDAVGLLGAAAPLRRGRPTVLCTRPSAAFPVGCIGLRAQGFRHAVAQAAAIVVRAVAAGELFLGHARYSHDDAITSVCAVRHKGDVCGRAVGTDAGDCRIAGPRCQYLHAQTSTTVRHEAAQPVPRQRTANAPCPMPNCQHARGLCRWRAAACSSVLRARRCWRGSSASRSRCGRADSPR
eukprot:COSAG01_NODE_2481_length_7603_cov_4.629398_7_plen_221_part_00